MNSECINMWFANKAQIANMMLAKTNATDKNR